MLAAEIIYMIIELNRLIICKAAIYAYANKLGGINHFCLNVTKMFKTLKKSKITNLRNMITYSIFFSLYAMYFTNKRGIQT